MVYPRPVSLHAFYARRVCLYGLVPRQHGGKTAGPTSKSCRCCHSPYEQAMIGSGWAFSSLGARDRAEDGSDGEVMLSVVCCLATLGGGALAGSCSERRPLQPSAQCLGPHLHSPTNNLRFNHGCAVCPRDIAQPVELNMTEANATMTKRLAPRCICSVGSKWILII